MPATAVACPHCHAALRSSRPVPAGRMVRCPECKAQFSVPAGLGSPEPVETLTAERPAAPLSPAPATPTANPARSAALPLTSPLFLAAVVSALLVGFALVAGAIILALSPSPPLPAPVQDPAAEVAEKPHEKAPPPADDSELKAKLAELQKKQDDLEKKGRALEARRLVQDGQAALAKKDFPAAEKAFTEALSLNRDDAEAVKGLVEVRAVLAGSERSREEEARRKAQAEKLLAEGRKAATDKQLLAAVRAFESARQLLPLDEGIRKELASAQAALDADGVAKKAQVDYQTRMDAARGHMLAGRPADALREYLAAQRVIPGDADAVRGQKAAEAQLAAAGNREKRDTAVKDLLDRSREAARARRYQEALDTATSALQLAPTDPTAKRLEQTARESLRQAKLDYSQLLVQARTAFRLGRVEEAFKLFGDAARILPEDREAQDGLLEAQRAVEGLAVARVAYGRFMDQGALALQNKRSADAVVAFTEALRLVPGDLQALKGLRDAKIGLDRDVQRKVDFDRAMQAGTTALSARRFADASKAFKTALAIDSDNLKAQAGLSQARYGQGMQDGQNALFSRRKADAIKAYEAALDERPNDPQAMTGLRQARLMKN